MLRFVLLGLLAASSVGCASLSSLQADFPWSEKKKQERLDQVTPVRMVCYWSEMVLNTSGKKPVRGFGGRVYFFNKHGKAVKANGTLAVYAYDDTDKTAETASRDEADFTFIYKEEEFATYYSKSEIGDSYSVWVPWDEVGGEEKNISLVPKFTTQTGKLVTGQMSQNTLSGKKKKSKTEPLSDSERFLRKQLEGKYGEDADEIAALLYSGKTADEWVNSEEKERVKAQRRASKEVPLTESMIERLNAAPPQPSFIMQAAAQPQFEVQEEMVDSPKSTASVQEKTVTAAEFDDQMANPARSRRFRSLPNRRLSPSSPSGQSDLSQLGTIPNPESSQLGHPVGPQPVVRERGPGESEFESTPAWMKRE
jgi:hypothetical protein